MGVHFCDRFSDLSLAGQLGLTPAPVQQLPPTAVSQAVPALSATVAPGKARSSMNLHVMSGR